MTGRVAQFLDRYNAAARAGDWAPLAAALEGARPPAETIELSDVRSTQWTDTARYRSAVGNTGTVWLAWTGSGELRRVIVDGD
jgi:hypothetical protein